MTTVVKPADLADESQLKVPSSVALRLQTSGSFTIAADLAAASVGRTLVGRMT